MRAFALRNVPVRARCSEELEAALLALDEALLSHELFELGPAVAVRARALRLADGPDEVHLDAIAKAEIKAEGKAEAIYTARAEAEARRADRAGIE